MSKCHSCKRGFNGLNGNGYSPCSCSKEAKPEFVQPPPLIPIGRPRLGWKPKPSNLDPYKKLNAILLLILSSCIFMIGVAVGYFLG